MNYRVTRIVGVRDDIEMVKLSCNKRIKITPQEYQRKLYNFYDSWGVKLDYVEIEAVPMLVGQKGGRRPAVPNEVLLKFIKDNPTLTQKEIASNFGVSHQAVSYNILKLKKNG